MVDAGLTEERHIPGQVAFEKSYEMLGENPLTALPHEGFRWSDYRVQPASPTRLIDEGDIVDLGNRRGYPRQAALHRG